MRTMIRWLGSALLLGACGAASAHTGHGIASLFEGLAHPFGLDHLLAMVTVGAWSALVLPAGRRWLGPAAFLAAMTVGAALGAGGLALPFVEHGIALSVALFGAMLLAGTRLPVPAGLALIALAAAVHGIAHGAELPAGGVFGAYAAGFLAMTAALHLAGVGLGGWLRGLKAPVRQALGLALAGGGVLLLARL